MVQKLLSSEHFISERVVFATEICYPFSPRSYDSNTCTPDILHSEIGEFIKPYTKIYFLCVESQKGFQMLKIARRSFHRVVGPSTWDRCRILQISLCF